MGSQEEEAEDPEACHETPAVLCFRTPRAGG